MVAGILAGGSSVSLEVGQSAKTNGYYVAGDGGGAPYLVAANQAVDGFGDHLEAITGNALLIQISNAIVNIKQFGAKVNASANDHDAIQAAIDYASDTRASVHFPRGRDGSTGLANINSPLNVPANISLFGDGIHLSGIACVNCSGLIIEEGVDRVTITSMQIGASSRHSTVPNVHVGITALGVTGSRPFNHTYRDLFIDGFETSVLGNWIWNLTIDNCDLINTGNGVRFTGLSVNNFIVGNRLGGSGYTNEYGIWLGDTTQVTEGVLIRGNLVDSFDTGIQMRASSNNHIVDNIFDHCKTRGYYNRNTALGTSANNLISGNYFGMDDGATAAIQMSNSFANTLSLGNIIANNNIIGYGTCLHGVIVDGTEEGGTSIIANKVKVTGVDCTITGSAADLIITGNTWNGSTGCNLLNSAGVYTEYHDNLGNLNSSVVTVRQTHGKNKFIYSDAAPISGTHTRGDIAWRVSLNAGGTVGFACVASGTPGTWKAWGNIDA
jgi:hypothetical protein